MMKHQGVVVTVGVVRRVVSVSGVGSTARAMRGEDHRVRRQREVCGALVNRVGVAREVVATRLSGRSSRLGIHGVGAALSSLGRGVVVSGGCGEGR